MNTVTLSNLKPSFSIIFIIYSSLQNKPLNFLLVKTVFFCFAPSMFIPIAHVVRFLTLEYIHSLIFYAYFNLYISMYSLFCFVAYIAIYSFCPSCYCYLTEEFHMKEINKVNQSINQTINQVRSLVLVEQHSENVPRCFSLAAPNICSPRHLFSVVLDS